MNPERDPGSQLDRADHLLDLERPADAMRAVSAVLADDPQNTRALCLAARAEMALQRPDAAAEFARRAHRTDPGNDWPLRLLALAENRRGQHLAAEHSAAQAVSISPFVWQTHQVLAAVLADNSPARALPVVERAIALAPQEPEPHNLKAGIALDRGDVATAEREYLEALRLDPQNSAAINGLGLVSLRRRRSLSAAARFADALGQDPRLSVGLHNLDVAFINTLAMPMQRWLWIFFIAAWLVSRVAGQDIRWPSLALAAVLALVLAVGAVRTVGLVRGRLRPYVLSLPRRDRLLTAAASTLLASVLLLLVSLLLPVDAVRGILTVAAVVCWIVAGQLLRRRVRRLDVAAGPRRSVPPHG
ncbi:tetratricopeptide repeat protein [Nakamurella sp. YIM 132087]|uniref:Tetratricopeptide repeat protein n=1 Tax=Nakamurella alba TaxID=2665158 RepID=A0A7K1FS27_9ACTN|nr:tetratricopeptide repeat protein [Nakamurella alba]MTD16941.1 tetratricopeptide repeat protein [Nakamurella alba]